MPDLTLSGFTIRGVAAAVPEAAVLRSDIASRFGEENAEKLEISSGVRKRHIVKPGQTTADLCELAARRLISDLEWDPASIDALILVTQTPDYFYPASACCLHEKLGLAKTAAAFDINLGCSGWVYGAWVAGCMILSGVKRILLLSGETNVLISPYDQYQALGGDAGTATAFEKIVAGHAVHFSLGTDGTGWRHLLVPAGAFRKRPDESTKIYRVDEDGGRRCDESPFMNGPEIFAFTIREVPPLIERILTQSGLSRDTTDYFILHQANKFMLDYLVKRMKLPAEKVPYSLPEYGNTSSASIPLTLVHNLGDGLTKGSMKLVLAGFGVGLSWGAMTLHTQPMIVPPVLFLP